MKVLSKLLAGSNVIYKDKRGILFEIKLRALSLKSQRGEGLATKREVWSSWSSFLVFLLFALPEKQGVVVTYQPLAKSLWLPGPISDPYWRFPGLILYCGVPCCRSMELRFHCLPYT